MGTYTGWGEGGGVTLEGGLTSGTPIIIKFFMYLHNLRKWLERKRRRFLLQCRIPFRIRLRIQQGESAGVQILCGHFGARSVGTVKMTPVLGVFLLKRGKWIGRSHLLRKIERGDMKTKNKIVHLVTSKLF